MDRPKMRPGWQDDPFRLIVPLIVSNLASHGENPPESLDVRVDRRACPPAPRFDMLVDEAC